MKEDLLKIINHYGVSHQLKKLSEEVFEFQEAVIDYQYVENYKDSPLEINGKEHMIEELGDVLVVLIQFIAYYNLNLESNVYDSMMEKIARQLKRIEAENDNN